MIVTEYNEKYGPIIEWQCENNENSSWDGSDYFGASLKSFEIMLNEKNFKLVGCNITGSNAFFVRSDLINNNFINEFSSEKHYMPTRYHLIKYYEPQLKQKIQFKDN